MTLPDPRLSRDAEHRVWWTSDELPSGPIVVWRGTTRTGVREVRYLPESVLLSESFLRLLDSHIASILDEDDMPCLADWESAMGAALKALANREATRG